METPIETIIKLNNVKTALELWDITLSEAVRLFNEIVKKKS